MTIPQRQAALRRQLEAEGIYDQRVLETIQQTRRDLFVPQKIREQAYDNIALPIGCGQTISQPYIVALMTQELKLTGSETVLEIGTGSGYQSAVLSQLCRQVVTIERIDELLQPARLILAELGLTNIDFRVGDGTLGCADRTPYDGIIVTAAAPDVPAPLFNQLKMEGRLVIPVGDEFMQTLMVALKREPEPLVQNVCGCRFVKLIGEAGWPEG